MVFPTGIRRAVLAVAGVPLVATLSTVMLASPSSAAAQSVTAAQARQAPSGHVYRTLVTGLRVRRAPSTSAGTRAVLGAAGSAVTVDCYALGSSVFGDSVWYHLVAPHTGYVAGFYLNTGRDPAAGIPACAVRHAYQTLAKGLRVRKTPSTSAQAVAVLGAAGSAVTVDCYALGSSVFGDSVWYHLVAPHTGYVAGFYLNTGADPAAGIPRC